MVHHTEGTAAHLDRLDEHGAFKQVAVHDQVGKPGCRRRKITSVGMFTVALLTTSLGESEPYRRSFRATSERAKQPEARRVRSRCAGRSAKLCMVRPTCVPRHYTQSAQDCTINMLASRPVHPGCCRLTTLPPISSVTVLQSSQSVPDEGRSFTNLLGFAAFRLCCFGYMRCEFGLAELGGRGWHDGYG